MLKNHPVHRTHPRLAGHRAVWRPSGVTCAAQWVLPAAGKTTASSPFFLDLAQSIVGFFEGTSFHMALMSAEMLSLLVAIVCGT